MRMSTPEEIAQALLILASSPDVEHRNLAAVDPRTPGEGLAAIFASGYYSYQLLHTPNLDTIMRFRYHKRWVARWAVVINPHTPLEVWLKMTKDRSSHVRSAAMTRLGRTDLVDLLGGL